MESELLVRKISHGYVIDHLPEGTGHIGVKIFGLENDGVSYALLRGVESRSLGKKDVLKIYGDRELSAEDAEKLALLSPTEYQITLNRVEDGEVKEKRKLPLPEKISDILRCLNGNCITNYRGSLPEVESYMQIKTRFSTISKNPIRIRCDYCERAYRRDEFDFL